jgi:formamidopyrimidine-DNA glycosylase
MEQYNPHMPELPEVETIAKGLRAGGDAPGLVGVTIDKATIGWPRHIDRPSPTVFRKRIRGQVIQDVRRRGKFLVFPLKQDTLLIHLRMSGDLYLKPREEPLGEHVHTSFELSNGWSLRFKDTRKFGRVYLVGNPETVIGKLGPEPLSKAFSAQVLESMLSARKRQLKPLLLDQTFVAGLGNIYVDEALHQAKLHPLRKSHDLNTREVARLHHSIVETLQRGIRHNGASIDWVYRGGGFQAHFRVYGRAQEPCTTCGALIQRRIVGQRSTFFCPSCQPEA